MRNRKVLVFFPSYRGIEAAPPLALLALAPLAEQRGLTVDVIDSTVSPRFLQRIIDQLDQAVCVGISIVTGPMIVEATEVARAVRAARPEIPVVLGSWHHSTLAQAQPDGALYRGGRSSTKFRRLPWIDKNRHAQIQRSGLCTVANRLLSPLARAGLDAHLHRLLVELWAWKWLSRMQNFFGCSQCSPHTAPS